MDPRDTSRMNEKAAVAASIHDVPDDLLKLILLRLASSLWLIRAASTCKRWRGVVAANDGAAAFLRLSGTLHSPAIAGHYHLCKEMKEFISSSPVDGNRFSSFDFLPGFGDNKKTWWVADCYGGLVLLCKMKALFKRSKLYVCDPLARQYRRIHHPFRNTFDPNQYNSTDLSSGDAATLMDGEADGGGISFSNFRILYRFDEDVEGYVFSTAEGDEDWPWRPLNTAPAMDDIFNIAHVAGRVDGSLFLGLKSGRLVVLDKACLEFSEIDLPTSTDPSDPDNCSSFRVVHSSGAAGMEPHTVRIVHVNGEFLEVFLSVDGDWTLEHSVPRLSETTRGLPGYREKKDYDWVVEAVGDGAGFVVLSAHHCRQSWLVFSVDLDTMEMAVVPDETYRGPTCSYTLPWPSFQACVTKPEEATTVMRPKELT